MESQERFNEYFICIHYANTTWFSNDITSSVMSSMYMINHITLWSTTSQRDQLRHSILNFFGAMFSVNELMLLCLFFISSA